MCAPFFMFASFHDSLDDFDTHTKTALHIICQHEKQKLAETNKYTNTLIHLTAE